MNWIILISFALIMFLISPRLAKKNRVLQFFSAKTKENKDISLFMLTSSLLISWIFAKSIYNAASLGQNFGAPGGAAYAAYWLSFLVAGWVILSLRRQGFLSFHSFLESRYGKFAIWIFSFILVFRLWNEIWSNTIVVGQFFGERGGTHFYIATWGVSFLVLAYSLKSGLRSSIFTDLIQMLLATVLLFVILAFILPKESASTLITSGEWKLSSGVDLLFVALIQIWSYPFHDPVMTDRGFITEEKKMLKAFILSGVLGVLFIFLFSFVGIFNQNQSIGGNPVISTAQFLGLPLLFVMNVIMLTSAASTIDSTFASSGKLIAIDLFPRLKVDKVLLARISMISLAVLGGAMVHASPTVLSATTISGTMVIGLAPVFIFNKWKRPSRISYYLSVLIGVVFGFLLATKSISFSIGSGKYGVLLWANVYGTILSFSAFFLGAYFFPKAKK